MVWAVWSAKGGVGVTSTAALLAIGQVERAVDVLLVDLCGDAAAVFGVAEIHDAPGVVQWCAMASPTAEALARIEIEVLPGLRVIPRGRGDLGDDPAHLMAVLDSSTRQIIVDCGLTGASSFADRVISACGVRLLVVRPCFLGLRATLETKVEPTGVVMLRERDRVLGLADVESVIAAPVVAIIEVDGDIARRLDSGLSNSPLPRRLIRAMGRVSSYAA